MVVAVCEGAKVMSLDVFAVVNRRPVHHKQNNVMFYCVLVRTAPTSCVGEETCTVDEAS